MIVIAKMEIQAKNFGMMLGAEYAYVMVKTPGPTTILFRAFKPYHAMIQDKLLTVQTETGKWMSMGSKKKFDGQGLVNRQKLVFPRHLFRVFSK